MNLIAKLINIYFKQKKRFSGELDTLIKCLQSQMLKFFMTDLIKWEHPIKILAHILFSRLILLLLQ